jgi:radical SAM protein with 4Fe4S-binding SPASM domain
MSDSGTLPPILWLRDIPRRPLCDVPWMGNTVVLANGDVNFCCFSDTVVGNVNQSPLSEIWNNETMSRIRRGLRDQVLPPECRSTSCPIFRGDQNHILLTRMEGAYRKQLAGTTDPHSGIRSGFSQSRLIDSPSASAGRGTSIELELRYEGAPVRADVYLAIQGEDRVVRFLPRLEEVPLPYRVGMLLPTDSPCSLRWPGDGTHSEWKPGEYEVCAAVFESGSHPNVASNCYWSIAVTLHVGKAQTHPGSTSGRRAV